MAVCRVARSDKLSSERLYKRVKNSFFSLRKWLWMKISVQQGPDFVQAASILYNSIWKK